MLGGTLKPLPEGIIVPSVGLAGWLAEPECVRFICDATQDGPDRALGVHLACWVSIVITDDEFAAEADTLACDRAAWILLQSVFCHQPPLIGVRVAVGGSFGHERTVC